LAKDHAYTTLDGLRGVAAISVVIFHYSENLGWQLLPNAYLARRLLLLAERICHRPRL